MAPSNLLMMPTDMMYLFCELYHLLAVSDDHIMFIFIVLIFPIHRQIYFEIISFAIDEFDQPLRNKVGDCTIIDVF